MAVLWGSTADKSHAQSDTDVAQLRYFAVNKHYVPLLMVLAGASNYLGAALAVYLFDVQSPWIVAWMRVGAAGIILVALVRPKKEHWKSLPALVYGVVTLGMNTAFYEAIDRIPLGMAVAIEFIGPIAVAAWGSRTVRDWVALVAAATGSSSLAERNGARIPRELSGLLSLACCGACISLPPTGWRTGRQHLSPWAWGLSMPPWQ